MRVIISGRHISVTKAIKDYAREKAERFDRYHRGIDTVRLTLDVEHGDCIAEVVIRARRNTFVLRVQGDDMYAVSGYLKLEAWPAPDNARVRIIFDPSLADEQALKEAITEPYYDATANIWRSSPFQIEGYDPLGLD